MWAQVLGWLSKDLQTLPIEPKVASDLSSKENKDIDVLDADVDLASCSLPRSASSTLQTLVSAYITS